MIQRTLLSVTPRHALSEQDLDFQAALEDCYRRMSAQKPGTGVDLESWRRESFLWAGQQGLLISSAVEGVEQNLRRSVIAEEVHTRQNAVGRGLPFLSTAAIAHAILSIGTDSQVEKWLPSLASGEQLAVMALQEAGVTTQLSEISSSAVFEDDKYILNGTKVAGFNAEFADIIVVLARCGDALALFVLSASANGITIRSHSSVQDPVELELVNVEVSTDCLLGGSTLCDVDSQRLLGLTQLNHCARSISRADIGVSQALACAKNITVDGSSLFGSQSVKFEFSEMKAELIVARAFLDETLERYADDRQILPIRAGMASLWSGEFEQRVLGRAARIVGSNAYSDACPVAALESEAKSDLAYSGSALTLRRQISRTLEDDFDAGYDLLGVDRDPSVCTEEHQMYRASVRRFLEKEIEPYCHDWIPSGTVPRELYNKAAQAGLLGARIPLEKGGGGGDAINLFIFCEEMGRSRAGPIVGPLFQSDGLVDLLVKFATPEQQASLYPRILAGEPLAFAMTEPQSGSDARAFRTTAIKDGPDYIINGNKCFISFARLADIFLVLAKTNPDDPSQMGFFIVDAKTPGIEANRMSTRVYPCGDTCEVFFTDVRVPANALLGEVEGQALNYAKELLDIGHVQVASRALGSSDLAYRQALEFARDRTVFGKKLIDFDNSRAVLAQVKTEMQVARAALDYCYARMANGTLDHATGSIAKWWHSNFEWRTVDRCFQLFGGAGFISEHPISHQVYAARVQRILDGTDEIQKQTISFTL